MNIIEYYKSLIFWLVIFQNTNFNNYLRVETCFLNILVLRFSTQNNADYMCIEYCY